MSIYEVLSVVSAILSVAGVTLLLVILVRTSGTAEKEREKKIIGEIEDELVKSRQETVSMTQSSIRAMGEMMARSQDVLRSTVNDSVNSLDRRFQNFSSQNKIDMENMRTSTESRILAMQNTSTEQLESMRRTMDEKLEKQILRNEQRMESLRSSVEQKLSNIQEDNTKQLEAMRQTVDEKLQKSLDEKFNQSFKLVSDRLDEVYKGLGEMQNLASGVGDLKKVLSNVKTRGLLGEVQLGAILSEILSPEQYEENIPTKAGSNKPVEFAVRMPGEGSEPVYLPIDAKFPLDSYSDLIAAYDDGDKAAVDAAAKILISRLKQFAKDISEKYLDPPNTTDFAIMFLPVEGLYAEAVRRGLVEELQRNYKINIAGPTTMAALPNSLQMGFRTLAIQKQSGEAWKVLEGVKTEFDSFAQVLQRTQNRLTQAGQELDTLVGVRTRKIQSKLSRVSRLPTDSAEEQTAISGGEEED